MPEIFNATKQKQDEAGLEEKQAGFQTHQPVVKLNHQEAQDPKKVEEFVKDKLNPFELADRYSAVMRDEQPSNNPFDAYAPKPLMVYSFDSQLNDEYVLLLLRKHPITQLKKFLILILMIIAPFVVGQTNVIQSLSGSLKTASFLLWLLLTMGFAFESFLTWFFNVYIVTDERIIDIDFLSLIYKNVATAKLDNIEDITATTTGAFQSMFNFGTVEIQTSAEKREFEFELVPQPTKVTQFLHEMLVEEEKEKLEGRVN